VLLLPLMPALAIAFFKRHGRWKTDRAKDGYIKDSLNLKCAFSIKSLHA